MIATVAAALFAAPAQAVITNVQPWNGNDEPISGDQIFDYEELQAYVTSPSGGEICLQRYQTNPPPPCGQGGYLITPVLPFFAGFYPIAPGNLVPGHWMLVASQGSGDLESVTAISEGFWVRPCEENCPPANVQPRSQFKAQAINLANSVQTVCGLVNAASMLWRAREAAATVNLMMATYSGGLAAGFVLSIAVEGASIASNVVNGESVTAKLPGALGTVAEKACKIADKTTEAAESSWAQYAARWGADPPDPDYNQLSKPDFVDHESILGYPSWGFDTDRDNLDGVRAYAKSSLHAYERYQGADAGGDTPWEHAHAAQLGRDMLGYASTLRRGALFLEQTAARMRSEFPDAADRTFSQAELNSANALRDRLAATGFTADEVTRLKQLGATDDGIARLRRDLTETDPSDAVSGALDAELDRLADDMRAMAEEAELFGRTAGVAAGRNAIAPDPNFGCVVQGADQLTVAFDGSTVNPGRDPLQVEWDFGDGAAASGSSVTHRYAAKGAYTVTMTVTNDYTSVSKSQEVQVGPPGQRPTASFTATPQQGEAPLAVDFDASASSDADGSISEYHWDFGQGDSVTEADPLTESTYQMPDEDGYTVKLTVTDNEGNKGSTTRTVIVSIPQEPPGPLDDHITARPDGVVDVLGNDNDVNRTHLTVSGHSDPANGTVSCSALGACDYKADPGFTGGDSFTYTARDTSGLEAPATVYVTVEAPPGLTEPLPRDDTLVLRGGTEKAVDVLANDNGAGGPDFVGVTVDPQHGTVSCDAGGTCTYEPDADFSGRDGFRYSMTDDTLASATADVHVEVIPAGAQYTHAVTAAPDPVASGGEIGWGVGVRGATTELPEFTTALAGEHARKPGSTTTAAGWSEQGSGAKAGAGALLGDSLSVPLIKPTAAVSQGTGGDGHVPILVGERIYAFFHHQTPTQVSCVDRRTNRRCPGYPVSLNVGAGDIPGPGAVVGTRIYQPVSSNLGHPVTSPVALFCWETATARPCGLHILDRALRGSAVGLSTPTLIAGKIYMAADTGKLYCFDPQTKTACGTLVTGLSDGSPAFDLLAHGPRLFIAQQGGMAVCLDVGTGSTCPGWALPRHLEGGHFNLINRHAPDGSINGVCVVHSARAECFADETPQTATVLTDWPTSDPYYGVTQEAEAGTRTLFGALGVAGAGCFDWVTLAPCAGGMYGLANTPGWLQADVNGDPLPSAYGVTFDGACAIGLGDPGLVFNLDPRGFAPCTGLPAAQAVDLRDQRCDGGVGEATWDRATLEDALEGELAAVRVTVRDAVSGQVLATRNIVSAPLDLSKIDAAAHPSVTVAIAVTTKPDSAAEAWADAIPPRVRLAWKADPRQLCFKTTTQAECEPAPVSVTATLDARQAAREVKLTPVGCPEPTAEPTAVPTQTATPTPSATPAPQAEQLGGGDQLLACSDRRVVLEDVVISGTQVRLLGVADRDFAGQKVDVLFIGKRVTTATIGPDGRFAATAPLPAKKLRSSSRARYQARIGAETSLNLKLVRRMLVTNVVSSGGKVTISGTVVKPLAPKSKDRTITLQRVVACTRTETVTTFKPRSNGRYSITVDAPAGQKAAVYRLLTSVPRKVGARKLTNTFTLPRAVDFR